MRRENRQKGFTLIEMICALVIVGILSAIAGLGIVAGVRGYLFSKDNAAISAKAQVAISRISRELLECYNCSGTSGSVTMPFTNNLGQRYIRLNSGSIQLSSDGTNYDTLLDSVASLTMTYGTDKGITISFTSSGQPGGVTLPAFTTKIYPRNS
jgi:prepilin-type N-terminal cleavage/methylation domain-containing protein